MDEKITLIGCGNLGSALLRGWLESGCFKPSQFTITRRNIDTLHHFSQQGVRCMSDNAQAAESADIIILALKPYNMAGVLEGIQDLLRVKNPIIVSLSSGLTLSEIREMLGKDQNVSLFRVMPNTAADVGQSMSCICMDHEDQKGLERVSRLFDRLGKSTVIDESLMDAATVLGACGIAYVMRFIRAMVQGGIQIGFDASTASHIVQQVVQGAACLLTERELHAEAEIDKVTTPRGCTITGLNEMEHNGFSSSLIKGVLASYEQMSD